MAIARHETSVFHLMLAARGRFGYQVKPDVLASYHVPGGGMNRRSREKRMASQRPSNPVRSCRATATCRFATSTVPPSCQNHSALFAPKVASSVPAGPLGVFGPVPGVIGAIQASEVLKLIAGCGRPLVNRMLWLDVLDMTCDEIEIAREPKCPACGERRATAV